MAVQSLVASSPSRPQRSAAARKQAVSEAIRNNFTLSSWLLIGACMQTVLVLILPKLYALTPAAIILALRLVNTMLITLNLKPNPYLQGVHLKKSTAQVMDKDGNFPGPGEEKIAILLLGAKSNHPLGIFAPQFKTVGTFNSKMYEQLESADNQDNGFLGHTQLSRQDANGANVFVTVSYWRSIDDVHAYAHSPLHREAWKWWDSSLKKNNYVGIQHEVFEADRGMWETLYVNFQPTLLGATTYLKRGGKLESGAVADEWVSPLLEANRGLLRTSGGRRGQTHAAADQDAFGVNPYIA